MSSFKEDGRERSDSDYARELQHQWEEASVDSTEEEDARLARALQEELESEPPALAREIPEVDDTALAQAILSAEMAEAEERRYITNEILANDTNDYMRPKNFQPYFCRAVMIVTTFTMFLEIAINGFTIEPLSQNPMIGPSIQTLIDMGAKETSRILDGDFYRLFVPMILHGGFVHLLFNMVALWNIGFPMEREFGAARVAAVYIASGVMGILLSSIMLPKQVSVGASGAIFGLFGAAWSDVIQNYSLYGSQAKWALLQLLVMTIFNLGLGLFPLLDNFAHVGGFLCGVIMGFTMLVHNRYDVWGYRKARLTYQLVLQAVAITIVPIFFVIMMLLLYLEIDVANTCTWCASLSCVSTPWWDCSRCALYGGSVTPISNPVFEYNLTCPDSSVQLITATAAGQNGLTLAEIREDSSLIIDACSAFCP